MNKSYHYKPSPEEEEEFELEEKAAKADANSIGNTPFNVLMQQAGKLKSKQGEVFRRKYDSFPLWYQHSMFSNEGVNRARSKKFDERFKEALEYKEKGNESMKNNELYDAMHDYERALSIFTWIENLKEDWTRKEIEDNMIKECKYDPQSAEEADAIRGLQISCLLNLSLVYIRQQQWGDVIRACTEVLDIDPQNPKAFYRRAQARYLPMHCGATENEMALVDLKKAVQASPKDKIIKREYLNLKTELEKQQQRDSQQFGGLFKRGRIVEDVPNIATANHGMTLEDAMRSLKDAESASRRYYEDGKYEDSARLQSTVERIRTDIESFKAQRHEELRKSSATNPFLDLDMSNVTPQMIEDAKKHGLDLNDAGVRNYIIEVQNEMRRKNEESSVKQFGESSLAADKENDDDVKSVIDRVECKKLVDILCDGWDSPDNHELVSRLLSNRYEHYMQHEVLNEEVDIAPMNENNASPFESLHEYMLHDIGLLYGEHIAQNSEDEGVSNAKFSQRIMEMMEEKYHLGAVERDIRNQMGYDWKTVFFIALIAILFIRFLIWPNLNKMCEQYCFYIGCDESFICNPPRHYGEEQRRGNFDDDEL